MPNRKNSARRRARRRRQRQSEYRQSGVLTRLLIMLAVVAAVVLGVAIFFRVHTIEVQGNSIYSQEQVITASGLEEGDNLLMINRAAIAGGIKARMPYVRDVSVSPVMPDTVVIRVQESEIAALVQSDVGASWYINADGRVLGSSVEGFRGQIVELTGFSIVAPKVGAQASAAEGQESSMEAALQVLHQMEGSGIIEQITAIDAERSYDLSMFVGDRLEIQLGGTDQLEYKIQYLQAILEELEEYQTGVIDLTFDVEQVARFIARTADLEEETEEMDEDSSETEDTDSKTEE